MTISDPNVQPIQDSAVEVLGNLESTIKTTIATLDTAKEELKKRKEMLNDMFVNDPTFQAHDKAVKDATKIRSATKAQLLKQPAAYDLSQKVKEMTADLKESQNALSDYLREFQRLSGSNEITGDDGEVREIVYTAKLVKRSAKFS